MLNTTINMIIVASVVMVSLIAIGLFVYMLAVRQQDDLQLLSSMVPMSTINNHRQSLDQNEQKHSITDEEQPVDNAIAHFRSISTQISEEIIVDAANLYRNHQPSSSSSKAMSYDGECRIGGGSTNLRWTSSASRIDDDDHRTVINVYSDK